MSPLATYVVETIVTLVAITILAALVVFFARRVGVGRSTGPVELVGRLPLDGRRAIYLVRVDKKVFVLGASEAGLRKLGELAGDDLDLETGKTAPPTFRSVLERALIKKPARGDGST
jgi:flagellar biogenesis protein FliO